MGLWARFQKARAINAYLGRCPELFRRRYGYQEHYSVERVLATISAEKLSVSFADYACALFTEEIAFVAWVLDEYRRTSPTLSSARKVSGRSDGIFSILAARSAPSREQAHGLYRSLREEVAHDFNHGSQLFLPKPDSMLGACPVS